MQLALSIPRVPAALRTLGLTGAALLTLTAQPLRAQISYSIEYRNPTISTGSCGLGPLITEADVLGVCTGPGMPILAPVPAPAIVFPGGLAGLGLALHAGCVGHPAGVGCAIEVDALSYGVDGPAAALIRPGELRFSVDRMAFGFPAGPAPDVFSEAAVGEAAADVFSNLSPIAAPLPPFAAPPGSVAVVDGNGAAIPSLFAYPGLGLIEPTGPACPAVDPGDNVDALDVDGPTAFPIFFSLDGVLLDPTCLIPGTLSAPAHGVAPGSILISPAPGVLAVYALPIFLGLDLAGPGTDDLDALAVFENGLPGFQPSPGPFVGWGAGGASDMVLFSVRRGSAVVGALDSLLGIPIEPGDVLIPPPAVGATPGIFIAAENLGLITTRFHGVVPGDELDGLDVAPRPLFDCNGNGVEDAVDLATGLDTDCNLNGMPDGCEGLIVSYCTAGTTTAGCNATITTAGTPSGSAPLGFVIQANFVEGNKNGLIFYGINGRIAKPWGVGGTSFLCVRGPLQRTGVQNSGGAPGLCNGLIGLDWNNWIFTHPGKLGTPFLGGETVWAQCWFRDPPNVKTTSLSNAVEFVVCP